MARLFSPAGHFSKFGARGPSRRLAAMAGPFSPAAHLSKFGARGPSRRRVTRATTPSSAALRLGGYSPSKRWATMASLSSSRSTLPPARGLQPRLSLAARTANTVPPPAPYNTLLQAKPQHSLLLLHPCPSQQTPSPPNPRKWLTTSERKSSRCRRWSLATPFPPAHFRV